MRDTVRTLIVLGLAAFTLALTLPDFARAFGSPLYSFGYSIESWGTVVLVVPGSSADVAGVRRGDRLDPSGTPLELRLKALSGLTTIPHERVSMRFVRDGRPYAVLLSADAPEPATDAPLIIVRELVGIVFIVVAASLVLLRPSPMTWGFYLFCCAFNPAPAAIWDRYAPPSIIIPTSLASNLLFAAGVIGLDVFALRFPSGSVKGWRGAAERICLVALLPLTLMIWYTNLSSYVWGRFSGFEGVQFALVTTLVAFATTVLIGTYANAGRTERGRIQWVIFGSAVSLVAFGLDAYLAPALPYWVHALLLVCTVAMPLSVAYAVIRHRVIDVNFVISRALVYAVLTTLLVAVFSLIDWLVGKVLEQTKLALAAEIGAAVAFGFWINGLHRRVDTFIDSVLFRQRYLAAQRLARAAAGLPHAESEHAVDAMLAEEPADALELVSAAVFRAVDGRGFTRRAAVQWDEGAARVLDPSEQLVLHLKGERAPLRLDDIYWPRADLPSGDAAPVLAVPVRVRDRLIAVALYGSHTNGEALDPSEISSLERLAAGASEAYDHLEAETMRRELAELRARLAAASASGP